jgi:hypothetical protein
MYILYHFPMLSNCIIYIGIIKLPYKSILLNCLVYRYNQSALHIDIIKVPYIWTLSNCLIHPCYQIVLYIEAIKSSYIDIIELPYTYIATITLPRT